jgi:hypothetical protein
MTERQQFHSRTSERVFGLESVKDAEGNVIKEAPLPILANFQQRALDVALSEANAKTDLKIKLAWTERSAHRSFHSTSRSRLKRYRKEDGNRIVLGKHGGKREQDRHSTFIGRAMFIDWLV